MANPRKFSEKIALLNQKQAEETARFEQIMKEVSDVTSKATSASSSVGASPTGASGSTRSASGVGGPEVAPARPESVKSAGASPPQSSGKHLHINLGNQYRAGSLPNVNANNSAGQAGQPGQDPALVAGQALATSAAIHSIDFKTALSNLEELQHNQIGYRSSSTGSSQERGRSVGVGPMRSRPIEKRHDTSPYSGGPYLSPPLPENWRRANSDSALHQSANEACQAAANSGMGHRRGSDAYQRNAHGGSSTDNRDPHHHHGFIERPRSSCEMPRVPGINVYPSSQPPGQQIPISNNTGSLPDLSNMRYASALRMPLDQEDHSSGSQYSNNHLSVPVNHRYLHSCKQGLTLENNASTSQQDVRITYSQQQQPTQPQPQIPPHSQPQSVPGSTSPVGQPSHSVTHSPGHYVYPQPHSPVAPQSPNASQVQVHQQNAGQFNSLNTYRTSQMVNRPSPQSSPSLTFQGSPLSYSNNPSAPSSPTGHHGPPNLSLDPQDQNVFINQVHADFEQFSMMDSPSTTIGPYINSPSHTGTYTQSDILSVASELGSGDAGYFSTSPLQQLAYHSRTPTTTQQLTPQTPNTPTITLTDCSLGPDDLVSSDFSKDFGSSIAATFGQDLFPSDDALAQDLNSLRQEDINALRQGLDPLDLDELQRLASSDMVISDPTTEADFRLEQR